MDKHDQELAALLQQRKLLTEEQIGPLLEEAKRANKPFYDVLQKSQLLSPEQIAEMYGELLEVPYIDLGNTAINKQAMGDVAKQAAATYRFFAFDVIDNRLQVAMESPDDFRALEAVKFIAKKKNLSPEIFIASKGAIDKALGGAAEVQAEIGTALRDFGQELDTADVSGKDEEDLERFIEAAPVTKVVAVIIRHAIEGHASDIHLEPTETELHVRYRIDGRLHTSLVLPLRIHAAIISRIKILSHLKIDESRLPQDGRFSSTTHGRDFDFRVSIMPTVHGEKAVLRILDKSKGAPSLDDLGLWGRQQTAFQQHLKAPHGIILISGPTGAGKSTTLFSALSLIVSPEVNISTLEDPVEYEIDGVNQTQVNPDIGLTFSSGLRNLLRQDPDVLMVGEIRDRDTAALAIHASLTGHLVLSTIHTNDAIGTVPRLVDMGIDPFLLTATLRLLVAQRLVAALCQYCKEEQEMPESLREKVTQELKTVPVEDRQGDNLLQPRVVYVAKGCPRCHETGVKGRLGIFEVVPVSRKIRNAINEAADYDTLYDIARQEGAITMRQDGLLKALRGLVQYEDVMRVASESQIK